MPAVENSKWRDRAGVNGPLMRGAFPHSSIEEATHWQDLIKVNSTFVFDRAMIIHRGTAHRHPFGSKWFKMIAGTMNLTVADDFWEPVRQNLVQNLLGYLPRITGRESVLSAPPHEARTKPIVTYISRQGGGRRLVEEDHVGLVNALRGLEKEGICEVNVAMMERMSMREQIAVAARSTIIVGVHGNGLTHQLWMQPSLRSAVFEIWAPPSYVWDYEMLARNMGHKHYGVHNDTFITFPKGTFYEGVKFGDGFHGNSIPVYGPAVANKIRERLIGDVVES
jgi:protein O-GlcNAc transferase